MTFLRIVLFVVWLVSGIVSAACVLMHSGEGTGVSDVVMGQMGGGMSLGVVEHNLDRITYIAIGVFVVCLFAMMFVWPEIPVIKAAESVAKTATSGS